MPEHHRHGWDQRHIPRTARHSSSRSRLRTLFLDVGLSCIRLRSDLTDASGDRYEGVCRYFKSYKTPETPPRRHRHDSLIVEAEEDLARLSWPELMTAGGLAGVVAWLVSRHPKPSSMWLIVRLTGHLPDRRIQDTHAKCTLERERKRQA